MSTINDELLKTLNDKYFPLSLDATIKKCNEELDEYKEFSFNHLYMEIYRKSIKALKICKALTEIDIPNGEFAESLKEKLNEINKEDI